MKKNLVWVLLISVAFHGWAQESDATENIVKITEQNPTFGVSLRPLNLLQNTVAVDLDFRLAESHWLTVGPRLQLHHSDNSSLHTSVFESMDKGFGVGLNYRYFPIPSKTFSYYDGYGLYLSGELSFMNTTYHYMGQTLSPYQTPYGVEYVIQSNVPARKNISQTSGSLNIGYSNRILNSMYLDFYAGYGIRYSPYTYQQDGGPIFNANPWNTGYTGVFANFGVRIGIFLNRYKASK